MARSTSRATTQGPSLEEQLSALGIRYGSALGQFVKDNQDFTLLRPKEANDDLGFPLWLRVHMRDADYAGRHAVARLLASKSDERVAAIRSGCRPAARLAVPLCASHRQASGGSQHPCMVRKDWRLPDGKIALSARSHAAISLD